MTDEEKDVALHALWRAANYAMLVIAEKEKQEPFLNMVDKSILSTCMTHVHEFAPEIYKRTLQ